eukprot:COSAG06_NODE_1733_length_8551_cov_24.707170_6_plen_129_part_00
MPLPLVLLLALPLRLATAATVEVVVPRAAGLPSMRVAAAVGSSSSFRLTVDFFDGPFDVAPLESPSLDPNRQMASSTHVSSPEGSGIKTSFGELLISDDGKFTLKDASGKTVAAATSAPKAVAGERVP